MIGARGLKRDGISDSDLTVIQDFAKRTTTPGNGHRLLQTRGGVFHLLARSRLTVNTNSDRADSQHLAASVRKVDVRDQEVGAAQPRIRRGSKC